MTGPARSVSALLLVPLAGLLALRAAIAIVERLDGPAPPVVRHGPDPTPLR
jgi:hypothetical protein